MDELFIFHRLLIDDPRAEDYHRHAIDKLQTLFPDKRITSYDLQTIGIETDSYYSETGTDTYEVGVVDDETPAIRNTRSDEVITFRV